MPRRVIDRIKIAIRQGNYDMTHHAFEEMAEDELAISDIENAALTGRIVKVEKDDPRGTRYTVSGIGTDMSTFVRIVGRFKETGIFLIITVYKIT